ncbi:glycosyltransferase family 4 protein [Acinetobacter soli]|uniref:glycosyltransferase family 4 protein n=1 Tax=Acinetobacter soli TaxID=487316 RepID=UPI003A848A9F
MQSQPKKIIFDTRWIGEHGIGRFAKELYDESIFSPIQLKGNPVNIFDIFKLTFYLMFHHGFYFSPGFNAPFFFLSRTAITIHDLNHIDLDVNGSFLKRIYYNFVLKRACKKSALVFTVSEFSKKRIIEWADIEPNKVKIIYNGVSDNFNKYLKPYQPGFKYIFMVGNRKLHKNENRGLEAFLMASIDKNIKILLTGFSADNLEKIINKYNAKDKVIFLGRLSEEELASIYKGALFLLFPSLYEGFGLPVIEAMACGTPVITSNTTSLPEVAGKAAIIINPKEITEIKQAIELLSINKDISNELRECGYKQIEKFSWKKSKRKLIENLEKHQEN